MYQSLFHDDQLVLVVLFHMHTMVFLLFLYLQPILQVQLAQLLDVLILFLLYLFALSNKPPHFYKLFILYMYIMCVCFHTSYSSFVVFTCTSLNRLICSHVSLPFTLSTKNRKTKTPHFNTLSTYTPPPCELEWGGGGQYEAY